MLNISWTNKPSYGGTKYWALVMDDCTGFLWSYFLKEKDELSPNIIALIKHLKTFNINVKCI